LREEFRVGRTILSAASPRAGESPQTGKGTTWWGEHILKIEQLEWLRLIVGGAAEADALIRIVLLDYTVTPAFLREPSFPS